MYMLKSTVFKKGEAVVKKNINYLKSSQSKFYKFKYPQYLLKDNKKTKGEIKFLKYFFINSSNINLLEGYELTEREKLNISERCTIVGNLIVSSGSSIIINGAQINISGSIIVEDEGYLSINDSCINAVDGCRETMFYCNGASKIAMKRSFINSNKICPAIKIISGDLEMVECEIKKTVHNSAIYFSGGKCNLYKCIFNDCDSNGRGGALFMRYGNFIIKECEFNNCSAFHGGAIYLHEDANGEINKCLFKKCKVKAYGSAISCEGRRPVERESTYVDCFPKKGVVEYFS